MYIYIVCIQSFQWTVAIQKSCSNKFTLVVQKLWLHYRGDIWQEGALNAFTEVAAQIFAHIRGSKLYRDWSLREGPQYVKTGEQI